MKKIKISHEVPFCLLEKSREFNDYDYCLPHLMDENEEYRNFFHESKKMGRYIVMDNSLHELGEAYNTKRLLYWVNEIEPNEFIVPDVWEDYTASVVNARQWSKVKLPKGVDSGQYLKLENLGDFRQGEIGDLVVQIELVEKDGYEKMNNDLIYNLFLDLNEVNDDRLRVPHPDGELMLSQPKIFDTSKPLRLKGKGYNGGDMYVKLNVRFERP